MNIKCNNCGQCFDETTYFCPTCGKQASTKVKKLFNYIDSYSIEQLYKNGEYDKLFDIAIEGDNIAKNYYVQYVTRIAKEYYSDWENSLKKVIDYQEQNLAFALSVYGFLKYSMAKIMYNSSEMLTGTELVKKAANMKEPFAMTSLGEWYLSGTKILEQDEYLGYELIKEAADMDYPPAMRIIGYWYYKGTGKISVDEELGLELLEKAAFMGEENARHILTKAYPDWLNDSVKYSLDTTDLEQIVNIVSSTSEESLQEEPMPVEINLRWENILALLEECYTLDDYIFLHNKLSKDIQDKSEIKNKALLLIESIVSTVLNIPVTSENISYARKNREDIDKAKELLKKYILAQHFLHFKEDLKCLNLHLDEPTIDYLLKYASPILGPKIEKELEHYHSYLEAVGFKKSRKDALGGTIFCTIVAITAGLFFPIVGMIIGIVAGILWISSIISKIIEKRGFNLKEDFCLINALVGYGYKIEKIETYYQDVSYTNNVSSVLANKKGSDTEKQSVAEFTINNNIICGYCGKETAQGKKFCKHCGNKLNNKEHYPLELDITYVTCKKCGTSIKKGKKFCSKCGAEI